MRGARALQGLTETDQSSRLWVSAFDLVSREAMLRGLSGVSGVQRAILS